MARGGIMTIYQGYRIYDTYAGYMVYNSKGVFAFSTKWGLPVIKDLIDDLKAKEDK